MVVKADAKGQYEIDNIDTPLGQACDDFLKADARSKTATEKRNEAEARLIEEIKALGKRTVKFKGDTIRYTPGHTTPEKISFRKGAEE